jgi:hypothetical protein
VRERDSGDPTPWRQSVSEPAPPVRIGTSRWARQGHPVYCYFDNDQKSAAPRDARRLMELVGANRNGR